MRELSENARVSREMCETWRVCYRHVSIPLLLKHSNESKS